MMTVLQLSPHCTAASLMNQPHNLSRALFSHCSYDFTIRPAGDGPPGKSCQLCDHILTLKLSPRLNRSFCHQIRLLLPRKHLSTLLEKVLTSPQFSPQNCMKITKKKECVLVDTSDSPATDYMFMFLICSCLKLFDAMLIPCDMSGGCRLRWIHRLQMTSPHQDGSFRIFWPHVCKKGGGGDVSSALMGLSQ